MTDNTCVCCGKIIPEGQHICLTCMRANDMQTFDKPVKTNGDRIRAMSDKELGKWLCSMERRALFTNSMTRPEGWQKWLESEVRDE